MNKGNLHPLTQFMRISIKYFQDLGFDIKEGQEIESEWYNFDGLNVPSDHPSRDVQDTFWTTDKMVLRTHTSAHQVKSMETRTAPVRIVIPGRIYRNEATDATHEAAFYQLEGFAIDKDINMSHLKYTLEYLFKKILDSDIEVRFYPSYFPFVEPGMEVAMKWKGKWLEMGGCGMIHPDVIANMGLDNKIYQGFAFGMGLDRMVMLERGIDNIRLLYASDQRFLKQF